MTLYFIHCFRSITIAVSYGKIWKVFSALRNREGRGNTEHRHTGIRTTVIILVAFVLYTLPGVVYSIVEWKVSEQVEVSTPMLTFQDTCTIIMAAGPAINTVIYAGTNLKFKNSVRRRFRKSSPVGETTSRKVTPGAITVASLTV